ncbi:MAG TPA: zinc-ribbon domain-containing protein [Bacteroidales bacterium]
MIIIAGAGKPKIEQYISRKAEHCYRCNNSRQWILKKTSLYITLFFLPLAPYKTTYTYFCPICNNSIELDKDKFEFKIRHEAEPLKEKA